MRVGVVILPEHRWEQARELWVRAEDYGFDHAWTYDHLAWRSLAGGPWFAAIPTLTAAALVTSRIRLGTFVASPNFRHPVPFAKEVMTLDDIAGGRLTVGVGAGGIGLDAAVLGLDVLAPKARADRLIEFVTTLDMLLSQDVTNSSGEYFSAVDARMIPHSGQEPRVPFVIAANGPRMLRLAAEFGQGWVTAGAAEAGNGLEAWWHSVAELSGRFDDALLEAGRSAESIDRYLSLDASGKVALASLEYFRECAERAAGLGFTDVVIHWPRPEGVYAADESVLDEIAAEFLTPRRSNSRS